jgi:hypothetical protein
MSKSMLNPPEREEYFVGALAKNITKGAQKHVKDIFSKATEGQKQVEKATKGQRATRDSVRKTAVVAGTAGYLANEWLSQNDEEPSAKEATAFEKAFSKAHNAGKETFTFKGKEYTTDVRKGKNIGGEMESSATTATREAAIEKDEKERKERMIASEAKRLGVSEERLKEILLEREQEEMDRKMQEASERQSRAPLLVGGQTKLDANKDGDITAEDFSMLRDRKAEGSEVYPEEPKLDEKNKYVFDEAKKLIESGKVTDLNMAMRITQKQADKKFGSDRDLMSPERKGEMDKNMKRHLEMIKILEKREKK